MKQPGLYVVHAAAVRDAAGVNARPGAVLVKEGRVVAAGDPEALPPDLVDRAEVIDRRDCLLLPAMVNAHTHLELTSIGPRPYKPEGGFVGWVKTVRSCAPDEDTAWEASLLQGAAESIRSGIQCVGDICRPDEALPLKQAVGLDAVIYCELFGLGQDIDQAQAVVDCTSNGLQPHAPYSAGPALYEFASQSGRPISTHLAEHPEEADFVGSLAGPMYEYVRSIGKWDDRYSEYYGKGLSPVQWMRPYLRAAAGDGGWLVAHCNYVDDDDIKILADSNTSVAYCPIASEYYGHTGHRYRDMLAAGVNVCLGTDSIVCAVPEDPQPLGLLGAMRRLYERDDIDTNTLLAMATTHAARALRLDQSVATLQCGAPARFACIPIQSGQAIDPFEQVLKSRSAAERLCFEWWKEML